MPFDVRRCSCCKTVKPLSEFARTPGRTGLSAHKRRCPPCEAAYLREWKAKNRERLAATKARYYRANKATQKALGDNWRAKHLGSAGTVTVPEYDQIVLYFEGRCAYCGDHDARMTFDHVLPLKRGGAHAAANIVLACGACNGSKRHRSASEFFAWLGREAPEWARDDRSPLHAAAAAS